LNYTVGQSHEMPRSPKSVDVRFAPKATDTPR
jgi:hypothetical protein